MGQGKGGVMMQTNTIETFIFSELDDEAKETAINNYREGNLEYDWWDNVYYDATEIGKIIGIDIDRIYFSGFSSQGDGACFEGDYSYKKGSVKAIKAYAPLDKDLHQIAIDLSKVQRPAFYKLSATVKQQGFYMHENCTTIDVLNDGYWGDWATVDHEEGIKEALRSFMQWIYSSLEKGHDWLNADEQIIESIEANEHVFLANGESTYYI
jgi:hypothetical protein